MHLRLPMRKRDTIKKPGSSVSHVRYAEL